MRAPYLDDGDVVLYAGDCVEVMAELPEASVDAVVTDPPYGLEFMGREWDSFKTDKRGLARTGDTARPGIRGEWVSARPQSYDAGKPFQTWCETWAAEALRVLKPGGHLVAFGGTRTYHRLACALEDAGFEIRDCLVWLYGSGFPKSLDVSRAIDKAAGAEREVVERVRVDGKPPGRIVTGFNHDGSLNPQEMTSSVAITPEAAAWQGWGTALKPGHEPIVLARKPLAERTVVAQVLATGTGALNIDGTRIVPGHANGTGRDGEESSARRYTENGGTSIAALPGPRGGDPAGRWPSNAIFDEEAASLLDAEVGERPAGVAVRHRSGGNTFGGDSRKPPLEDMGYGDTGGPSRFFYTAKAGADEREGSKHPTVKPLALMRWLVRLVTPPGGLVLEPFAGSGTTLRAAREEGFRAIGIEREEEYLADAAHRLRQLSLFGGGA
ncbi:MAG TPA: site-specific DNA-methyltransferase [Gemmatimonadota bacterium]|nr:site-specific DNA-methyltransferase [Gemmatimonadota bacterium]